MTLRTENNSPNRKIRFQAYTGIIVTVLIGGMTFANKIFGWGIEINEENIAEAVTGFLVFITFITTIVGYVTHPEEGDGTK
jgi:uncharacterized membrane protein